MRKLAILIPLFLVLSLAGFGQDKYDPGLAEKYKADDYGMKKYVMAFLKRGPEVANYSKEERDKIQQGHMAHIGKMAEAKKLVLAGPFFGEGELRGIFLFDVDNLEEAEKLTSEDPAVKAGVLTLELLEWYGSAAVMAIPEIHEKIQKIEI
ncbi:YciI family protein [Echinicola salinicaeni]|uniref:YciI family protein n=1 Tax=Echinicola salinicaeni TaxID=2762757 RepID=UPI001645191F|nr:YciI family protein [Echinicola salinicaeni]